MILVEREPPRWPSSELPGKLAGDVDELFGVATSLDFIFHRPDAVVGALCRAGVAIEARLGPRPLAALLPPSTYMTVAGSVRYRTPTVRFREGACLEMGYGGTMRTPNRRFSRGYSI